ncbi:MAG: dTDP-4-dehydrorhamnose reductase [Deltaproteobacteria bacterium]|nr:dTDP-4-dehydrorhamnose reductase [Deltaproteobacteria bacterium]
MRIVVTGGSGMLGHGFMRRAAPQHQVCGTYHTHPVEIPGCHLARLDITDEPKVDSIVKSLRPDVVIHSAGLTDVDACERAPEKARRINSDGTAIVAKAAEQSGAHLIYISTDYVFDGSKGNYVETDAPNPVNQYGASKYLGEEYAQRNCTATAIIRTTMFGLKLAPQVGMMESMVAALRQGKSMTRFVDQYFSALYTGQLNEVILRIAERRATGVFHIGSVNKISRFEFSKAVAKVFSCDAADIHPGPFRQMAGLARRPQDTSLVSAKISDQLGIAPLAVHDGLYQLKHDWQGLGSEGTALH